MSFIEKWTNKDKYIHWKKLFVFYSPLQKDWS